jgi:hypothetical protein
VEYPSLTSNLGVVDPHEEPDDTATLITAPLGAMYASACQSGIQSGLVPPPAAGFSATTPAAHGISIHREIELLTEAGLSPLQVLRAATARTADAFSLSDRGRIVVGRRADLVMVRGNPIDDITATRDILRVWRAGVALRR